MVIVEVADGSTVAMKAAAVQSYFRFLYGFHPGGVTDGDACPVMAFATSLCEVASPLTTVMRSARSPRAAGCARGP